MSQGFGHDSADLGKSLIGLFNHSSDTEQSQLMLSSVGHVLIKMHEPERSLISKKPWILTQEQECSVFNNYKELKASFFFSFLSMAMYLLKVRQQFISFNPF